MKRKLRLFLAIFLVLATAAVVLYKGFYQEPTASPIPSETLNPADIVTLTVDYGDGTSVAYQKKFENDTAFSVLEKALNEKNVEIKTKKYDFGVFIEQIGGRENSKDKAWIFYVNGKSADKSSDNYQLNPGDQILFKYEKPIY